MNKKQRQLILGIKSEKFLDLCDHNDVVALYLDEQASEEDLLHECSFDSEYFAYGLIALNWHIVHNISYEYSYAKLFDKAPINQEDFDLCLEELQLLPTIKNKVGDN